MHFKYKFRTGIFSRLVGAFYRQKGTIRIMAKKVTLLEECCLRADFSCKEQEMRFPSPLFQAYLCMVFPAQLKPKLLKQESDILCKAKIMEYGNTSKFCDAYKAGNVKHDEV